MTTPPDVDRLSLPAGRRTGSRGPCAAPRLLVAALACAVLISCGGGDDGSSGDAGPDAPASADQASGDDAAEESGDAAAAGDDAGLGPYAVGLETAMVAERVEVVDGTIHVHLDDDAVVQPGRECAVATAATPDGTPIVIHRDGEETVC